MRIASLLLALALMGIACTADRSDDDSWVTVGSAQALIAEGVVYSPDLGVFVLPLDGGHLLALSDDAQHQDGERVSYCHAARVFIGPHGELFDREGRYIGGPAPSDLDLVPVRLEGTSIQVEAGTVIEAVGRSHADPPVVQVSICDGAGSRPGFVGPPPTEP